MYPNLAKGSTNKRSLSLDDLSGGNYVMNLSQLQVICGEGFTLSPMLPFVCETNSVTSNAVFSTIAPFPNPADDRIYFPIEGYMGTVLVSLRDQIGRIIIEQNQEVKNDGLLEIKFPPKTPAGIYFLEIKTQHHNGDWKVIIR